MTLLTLYDYVDACMVLPQKDDVPEIEEVFIVQLDSVSLVGASTPGIPPSLGTNTIAEVIIAPNDSPQGVITFAQDM